MNYFCDVNLQGSGDKKKRIFIVLNDVDEKKPEFTKEMLVENRQFNEFVDFNKPKLTMADYKLYLTETAVDASSQDEIFIELIEQKQVQLIGSSEIRIEGTGKKKKSSSNKKKKTASKMLIIAAVGVFGITAIGAYKFGTYTGQKNIIVDDAAIQTANTITNEDGMIIPVQEDFAENTEQITISIDRSYSAIPKEDLQLKGLLIDGTASITLPEFDKTDFFTHVAGYTWGFTSEPNGKKIEYYGGQTYKFSADTKLYRVLVKYGGGNGTKDDPYIINYYDQLLLMGEEKARGYFKQTADIEFPEWAVHTSINTVNELKNEPETEFFEYDGNGYKISNMSSPLFGTVSGAVIKNVNITNSVINSTEYKDYGFIVCNALNYRYKADNGKTYETGETLIQHCTVSHSAIYVQYPETEETTEVEVVTAPEVVPPDLIEYDENGKEIRKKEPEIVEPTKTAEFGIGAVSGIGGQIEGCYVNDVGIFTSLNDYFLYAGGISGKPANVVNSAVYFFSAQGNIFNAGGICGSGGGSRLYNPTGEELPEYYGGNIQGCTAINIILSTEVSAGGIIGEGTSNSDNAVISNCYANELDFSVGVYSDNTRTELEKSGSIGGVIGCDGNENNGHIIMNTVSPEALSAIGNAVKSKFDNSIRLAPDYAYYQENILTIINKNTINPDKPKEIFTGNFKFGDSNIFGDNNGSLAYPADIEDLFEKTYIEEENE